MKHNHLCRCVQARPVIDMILKCESDVISFALQCVPSLAGSSAADITVKPLTGGLTNVLHLVKHKSNSGAAVVRQYGEGTEGLVDRDNEEFWVTTYLQSFGRCQNGLAFTFLDGYRTATIDGYLDLAPELARSIANLHAVGARMAVVGRPMPHSNFCLDVMLTQFIEIGVAPQVLSCLPDSPQVRRIVDTVTREVPEMKAIILRLRPLLQEGYCHNDLNIPNTMIHSQTSAIQFIDFEYTSRNFYLYDIGNHFIEHAGFDGQWERCLSREGKLTFLRNYYETMARETIGDSAVVEGSMEAELALTEYLGLVSHLGWSAWSLSQSANSKIEFDFIAYANMRLDRFDAVKASVQAAVEPFLQSE